MSPRQTRKDDDLLDVLKRSELPPGLLEANEKKHLRFLKEELESSRGLTIPSWGFASFAVAALALLGVLSLSERNTRGSDDLAWPSQGKPVAGQSKAVVERLRGATVIVRAESEVMARVGSKIAPNATVSVTGGEASLRLPSGAEMELSSSARLAVETLSKSTEWIRLDEGRAELEVPRLKDGRSLRVKTFKADVDVIGTVFSVHVTPERVCVGVTKGIVRVTPRESSADPIQLTGEQNWSSDGRRCRSSEKAKETVEEPVLTPRSSDAQPVGAKKIGKGSTLGEENQLLTSAVRARQKGKYDRARELLNELEERFADSPLRKVARRERELLNSLDKK